MRTLAIVLALISSTALAQTDEEREACHQDALRWCKYAMKGNALTVVSCLAANKSKLNPRCRAILTSYGM